MIFIEMMLKVVYLEKFNIFNVLIFNNFLCPLHKPTQIKLNGQIKYFETGQKDFKTFFSPNTSHYQVYFVLG